MPRVRNESRIAFLAHSLTCQPVSVGAATRTLPSSSSASASSTVAAASSPRSLVARSYSSSISAARAVRSVAALMRPDARQVGGAAAVLGRRDERDAHVALAAGAEERAGRDDDAALVEQAQRERLGVLAVRHAQPQEERRVAARRAAGRRPAARAGARRAWRGSARGPRRRASSSPQAATAARWTNSCGATPTFGPVALQRGDEPRVAGDEARSGSRASRSAWRAC